MKSKIRTVFFSLLSFLLLVPHSYAKDRSQNVQDFDVAGVKLGMSPLEARTALVEHGFSVSDDRMSLSWAGQIAAEAGKYVNTPKIETQSVWLTSAKGPDYQSIEVTYEIRPAGSVVATVTYQRPASTGDIWPTVRQRYGLPTWKSVVSAIYCADMTGCPERYFTEADFAYLLIYSSGSGRSSVTLSQGRKANLSWKSDFYAAVRAIAPAYGKAGF